MNADITLENAKRSIRQREAVHKRQDVLIGNRASTVAVDTVKQTNKPRKPVRAEGGSTASAPPKQCTRDLNAHGVGKAVTGEISSQLV